MRQADHTCSKPSIPIVLILLSLASKYRRKWVYPNQLTLLKLLAKHHRITMSRRTLNRHLAGLEAQGYIRRFRRHKKTNTGSLWLRSTVYSLRDRALKIYEVAGRHVLECVDNPVHRWGSFAVSLVAQSKTTLGHLYRRGALASHPPPP